MSLDLDRIRVLLERRNHEGRTHYDGCYGDHPDCAIAALVEEVTRLREAMEADR